MKKQIMLMVALCMLPTAIFANKGCDKVGTFASNIVDMRDNGVSYETAIKYADKIAAKDEVLQDDLELITKNLYNGLSNINNQQASNSFSASCNDGAFRQIPHLSKT